MNYLLALVCIMLNVSYYLLLSSFISFEVLCRLTNDPLMLLCVSFRILILLFFSRLTLSFLAVKAPYMHCYCMPHTVNLFACFKDCLYNLLCLWLQPRKIPKDNENLPYFRLRILLQMIWSLIGSSYRRDPLFDKLPTP